jgi:outer membrane protein assembly factor BamB
MFTINGRPRLIAVADGVIYFGDGDHHLVAVNAKDGKQIWKFTASDNIGTPAIVDGRAFFSDHGGNLYAVDLNNGKAIWKAAKKNKVATALAAYNKSIYYGGIENSLYAVNALTGEEKWVYRTKKPCRPPVAANGVIYAACLDNALLAIDAESGQERWKYETPHPPISHPVVGDGVIYYLDDKGVMYALGSA